jgi:hypothetical protein
MFIIDRWLLTRPLKVEEGCRKGWNNGLPQGYKILLALSLGPNHVQDIQEHVWSERALSQVCDFLFAPLLYPEYDFDYGEMKLIRVLVQRRIQLSSKEGKHKEDWRF